VRTRTSTPTFRSPTRRVLPHASDYQEPAVPVLFALLFFVLAATHLAA